MPEKHSVDARKKAALREAVDAFLPRIVPVIREGGSIPLLSVTEAIAGEKVGPDVRQALDGRGELTFTQQADGKAKFENAGRATDLALKAFKLKVPERLSGWAAVLDGDEGVALHFDEHHTLSACKIGVCAGVEAVEVTKQRIFVDLEGRAFDRTFDLDGEVPSRAPRKAHEAPVRKTERQAGEAKAPLNGRQAAAAPSPQGERHPSAEPKPQEEKQASGAPGRPAEKKAAPPPRPRRRRQPSDRSEPQRARRPSEAPSPQEEKREAPAPRPQEEKHPAGPQAALRGAVEAAQENVRGGIEKTLRSAAESGVAAREATDKAAQDAKTNVESGVSQAREGITKSREAAKVSARKASGSMRSQLEHSKKTISKGAAPQQKRGSKPRAHLGLTTHPVRLPDKFADEHGGVEGLMVLEVQPGGPADRAGLLAGDTLLALGDRPMRKANDLKQQLTTARVGQRLEAVVLRAGEETHLSVEVGTR